MEKAKTRVGSKIFYGWYMVAFGMVLSTIYSGTVSYGWTAFVSPIITTFGWSMAQISVASSLRTLEIGVFNPVLGPLVDRYNPKWLMLIGVIATSAGLFCLAQMQNLVMYYVGFFATGFGSSLVTSMLPLTIIARWFKRGIGKATGIFYMGIALGGVSVPVVVWLIDQLTWRGSLTYIAIAFLVLGIPTSFLFRTRPEDYGLVPDGEVSDATTGSRARRGREFGLGAREALKMRPFWHFAVVTVFQFAAVSPIQLYAIPYLTSVGMSRELAGTAVMLYSIVSFCGRMPMGLLSDYIRKSHMVAFAVGMQTIGLILLWQMDGTSPFWFLILFAITWGAGVSGVAPLRGPLLAEYFGTKSFGTIFGLSSIFQGIASVATPPLAGWIYDNYNDYKPYWFGVIIFGVIAMASILTMPRAQTREDAAQPEASASA